MVVPIQRECSRSMKSVWDTTLLPSKPGTTYGDHFPPEEESTPMPGAATSVVAQIVLDGPAATSITPMPASGRLPISFRYVLTEPGRHRQSALDPNHRFPSPSRANPTPYLTGIPSASP